MSGNNSNEELNSSFEGLLNSSSEGGSPIVGAVPAPVPLAVAAPVVQNARPILNERFLNMSIRYPSRIPPGTFSRAPTRRPLVSRVWGNVPFFKNAKPASMLERGYIKSKTLNLVDGEVGLFTEKDGIERSVRVINNPPDVYGRPNYTFLTLDPNPAYRTQIYAPIATRFEGWDFYTHTAPVAFVPRPGSIEAASLVASAGGGGSLGLAAAGGGAGSLGLGGPGSLGLGPGSLGLGGPGSLGLGGKRKIKKTRKNKRSKKTRRRSK